MKDPGLSFEILSLKNWNKFEKLFGEKGACGGCWCMYWRISRKEYNLSKGAMNKEHMKGLIADGVTTGMLAIRGKDAIGWCSFGKREDYIGLNKSRILRPVDDKNVWSISCFFIDKKWRNKGISSKLLQAVVEFCNANRIKILEAYPVEPTQRTADVFAWQGISSIFVKNNFVEVARRSATRPIFRNYTNASK